MGVDTPHYMGKCVIHSTTLEIFVTLFAAWTHGGRQDGFLKMDSDIFVPSIQRYVPASAQLNIASLHQH